MNKLNALAAYLRSAQNLKAAGIKCNPEKIDSWSESGSCEYIGNTSADGQGLYLFEHTYKGVFILEEVAGDIRLLLAMILTWLQENDPDRDDLEERNLKWEGTPFDDGTSDLQMELWFRETVHFAIASEPCETAHIVYKGTSYTLEGETVRTAENETDPDLIQAGILHD